MEQQLTTHKTKNFYSIKQSSPTKPWLNQKLFDDSVVVVSSVHIKITFKLLRCNAYLL